MQANTKPSPERPAQPTPAEKRVPSGDRYRGRWRWDSVTKGTHLLNCWYQRSCAYNVYVKDGAVAFEEPAAEYPRTNSSVPDFNPRGCQKGACYAVNMNQPLRVTHPLKRIGARGQGEWQQVCWEEALADIADRILDVVTRDGPEAVVFDGNATGLAAAAGGPRFAHLLGALP